MPTTATAAVTHAADRPLTLETVVLDDLRPDEVRVRIEACGICHTDTKFMHVLPLPGVFGHEGTGIVEEIGSAVTSVAPGQRVILSYPFCGGCPHCLEAQPYRCENIPGLKFGGRRRDGSQPITLDGNGITSAFFQQSSFASHAISVAQALVPVTTDTPPELLAALPCGIQTGAGSMLNVFGVAAGDAVLVVGAGAVGLSAAMAARLSGAHPVICVDIVPSRLELAMELGATHTLDAREGEVGARVRAIVPRGVRYALDASATVAGLESCLDALGLGGEVGIVSYPDNGKPFPFTTRGLFMKVGALRGIVQGFSIPRLFLPRLLALHAAGLFPYEKLVTTYPFAAINRALDDAHAGSAVKPVLLMP